MKRYYSRVDLIYSLIVAIPMAIAWVFTIPVIVTGPLSAQIILSFTMGSSTILIASIYTNTYYQIDSTYLYWNTGPFSGKLEINNIRSIGMYGSMFGISSIMKPILARNPLKIQYGKYDDMPFSPKEELEFINELKKVNNDIEIESNVYGPLEELTPS